MSEKSTMESYWADQPAIDECLFWWRSEIEYHPSASKVEDEIWKKTVTFLEENKDLHHIIQELNEMLVLCDRWFDELSWMFSRLGSKTEPQLLSDIEKIKKVLALVPEADRKGGTWSMSK